MNLGGVEMGMGWGGWGISLMSYFVFFPLFIYTYFRNNNINYGIKRALEAADDKCS